MIGIQPTFTSRRVSTVRHGKKTQYNTTPERNMNSDKILNSLAIIGLSTLMASCYYNEYLGDEPKEPPKTETPAKTSGDNKVTRSAEDNTEPIERMDSLLSSIGLLCDGNTSIKNVPTISFYDNDRTRYSIRTLGNDKQEVFGQYLSIGYDDSELEKFNFHAKNAKDGSLNVTKLYTNGRIEKTKYRLNSDGSVTKFDMLDNNYYLENSTYKKQIDGTIIQTFADGSQKVYDTIHNDYPWPVPITFGADVAEIVNGF